MINRILQVSSLCLIFLLQSLHLVAQANRTQLPSFLSKNTYFEVNIGDINYPFSNRQVEPGYHAASVWVPHSGVRLALFGYKFNKYLSVRVSYLRPVLWVHYKNVNGDQTHHSVTMNISGLTLKASAPFSKNFSIYGEGGFGIVTRTGFTLNNIAVVKNAGYPAFLGGAGLQYELNDKINFMVSGVWSPASAKAKQPYTLFFSGGVAYNMHPLSAKRVEENRNSGYIFPKNLIQVGFTTNVLGYGVNNFFSNKILPIFWGGDVQVKHGFALHYQHNVFHGRKLFSVDWGASFSYWTSNVKKNNFYTLSLFPLFRFTVLHFKTTDFYFNYSVAGPTYISMERIDNTETGKHFTFQDFMGMGIYTGKKRNLNAEIKISHYSNGDLYPQNNGVKVPLTFAFGYTF